MSINVLMDILGDNNTFTSCWNNNNEFIDSNMKYINIEEKDKNSLLVNPNSYEKGIKKSDIATLAVYLAPYASPDETTVYAPKNYSEPSVNAKCGTSNNPNPWYPPSQVDKNYTNFEKVMNAVINDERPGNRAYGSCAQASGAIIRATVDPDFETGNPALQIEYLDSNKDKWKLVKLLKPGDNLDKECESGDLLVLIVNGNIQ